MLLCSIASISQSLMGRHLTLGYVSRKAKLPKLERVSPKIREIAWKAQSRLTARYRALTARGKKTTVTCTAIARELAAFMWAVAREARPA